MSIEGIKLEAMLLEDGETVRVVCPFCGGGGSSEKSCNITMDEGTALYNCHRASCGECGAVGDRRHVIRITSQKASPKIQKFHPFEGILEHLSPEWDKFLEDKVGWTEWHIATARPMYAPDEDRVAYPIYSPMGLRRGWVLRSYEAFSDYKTLTRMDSDSPHMSFYRKQNTSSIVVVEDIPSAVRVARYADAVAINGGGIGPEYAMEIAAHYKRVVWAMDADATAQAIAMHTRFAILFEQSRVMVLERDLKDEDEPTLKEKLEWVT